MIYLLTRTDHTEYDEYDAKVVRARSEKRARYIANITTGDEGKIWTDPTKVTCEVLKTSKPEGIILASFNAG